MLLHWLGSDEGVLESSEATPPTSQLKSQKPSGFSGEILDVNLRDPSENPWRSDEYSPELIRNPELLRALDPITRFKRHYRGNF